MIQEVVASSCIAIDNKVWFVPMDIHCLCCYDMLSNEITRKISLPEARNYNYHTGFFERLILSGHKIIGIPYWADFFFAFDLDTEDLQIARFDDYEDDKCGFGYYAGGVFENEVVTFMRSSHIAKDRMQQIAIYNMKEKKAELLLTRQDFGFEHINPFDIAFRRESLQLNESLYLLLGHKNDVVEYTKDKRFLIHEIDYKKPFNTVAYIGDDRFCLSTNDSNLVIWDKKTNRTKVIKICIDGLRPIEDFMVSSFSELFGFSAVYKDIVFLFPYQTNKVIAFDIKEEKVTEASFSDDICCADSEIPKDDSNYACGQFSHPYIFEEYLYIWNMWSKFLFVVNLETNEVRRENVSISLSKEEFVKEFREHLSTDGVIVENDRNIFTELDGFIYGVSLIGED